MKRWFLHKLDTLTDGETFAIAIVWAVAIFAVILAAML